MIALVSCMLVGCAGKEVEKESSFPVSSDKMMKEAGDLITKAKDFTLEKARFLCEKSVALLSAENKALLQQYHIDIKCELK